MRFDIHERCGRNCQRMRHLPLCPRPNYKVDCCRVATVDQSGIILLQVCSSQKPPFADAAKDGSTVPFPVIRRPATIGASRQGRPITHTSGYRYPFRGPPAAARSAAGLTRRPSVPVRPCGACRRRSAPALPCGPRSTQLWSASRG